MSSSSTATTPRPPTSPDPGRPGRLVLRADGGDGRGIGHVVRALALAEAWRATGGTAVVAVNAAVAERAAHLDPSAEVVAVPGPVGGDQDRATTAALVDGADWLVVDGYPFDASFATAAGAAAERTVLVDDHGHGTSHPAAVVLDQNPGVDAATYPDRPAGSTLLLGPTYALLRRATVRLQPAAGRARHLLVVLGGEPTPGSVSDARAAVTALADLDLAVDVIGGGDLSALDALPGVTVHGFVADPTPLFARAEVALAAAGTTSWELCRHGVPAVVVAAFDNQVPVVRALVGAGAALAPGNGAEAGDLLRRLVEDPLSRAVLSVAGQRLVDGRGPDRVVAALRSRDIALRPAAEDDVERLWQWANDPEVRASAWSTDPIPWRDHVAWFEGRQADPGTQILVAEHDDRPWGQIRFERGAGSVAVVDVSVAGEARGRGLGAPLIRAGVRQAFAADPRLELVRALVRPENERSGSAFSLAGLTPVEGDPSVRTFEGRRHDGW